jgi:hypothetical protein
MNDHFSILLRLSKSLNRAEFAKSRAVDLWTQVVARILHPHPFEPMTWSFGQVTQPPDTQDEGFAATIVLTLMDVTVTAEFGAKGSLGDCNVWMAFAEEGRPVDKPHVNATSSTDKSFVDLLNEVCLHLREHQVNVARTPPAAAF